MTGSMHRDWQPYVFPFAVYLGFLLIQSRFPLESLVWLYPLKTIATAAVLLFYRNHYRELRWHPDSVTAPASATAPLPYSFGSAVWGVIVGVVAIVIWIAIDPYYPSVSAIFVKLSSLIHVLEGNTPVDPPPPEVFNPYTIETTSLRWAFIAFRIFGAVVVVALMEELFWRGFLIRWLIKEDFKAVPLGTFTWGSFLITVVLFGLEHDLWLAGLICGVLYNWLYYRTRSIPACVLAHAVSNAILAGYVLKTGDWKFW